MNLIDLSFVEFTFIVNDETVLRISFNTNSHSPMNGTWTASKESTTTTETGYIRSGNWIKHHEPITLALAARIVQEEIAEDEYANTNMDWPD